MCNSISISNLPVMMRARNKCNIYIECIVVNGVRQAIAKECAAGQFWDVASQSCKLADNVVCLYDPCRVAPAGSAFPIGLSCTSYYQCKNGRSLVSCCDQAEQFTGMTCQPDPTDICSDTCLITTNPQIGALGMTDDELCEGCVIYDGYGYNPFPGDCNMFVQCAPMGTGFQAFAMKCQVGFFWSQSTHSCAPADQIQCNNDRCKTLGDGSQHYMTGSCRRFYQCAQEKSIPSCCNPGFEFITDTCVQDADNSCTDECVTKVDTAPQWRDPCTYQRGIVGDNTIFEQLQDNGNWIQLTCPGASRFNPASCYCTSTPINNPTVIAPTVTGCQPTADFPFNNDLLDQSPSRMQALNTAKHEQAGPNGYISFDSNDRLVMWQFADFPFKQAVEIRIRYRLPLSADNGKRYTIIANCLSLCEDGLGPGVYLGIQTGDTDEIIGMVDTADDNNLQELRLPYNGGWVDLLLRYDGIKVRLEVDGNSVEASRTGDISKRQTALLLGRFAIPGDSNLIGDVDDLQVFTCLP
ncbi:hypothetical protein SNE40_002662 [Patella caerulea]|uniref:Chitin-binding type-2 domain-containing protein n=2 Tax=Patella caerulea TaxID=87958 RepID=A0AAN8Q7Q2_PATCE